MCLPDDASKPDYEIFFILKKKQSNGKNIAYYPFNCTNSSQVFERKKLIFALWIFKSSTNYYGS